MEKVEFRVTADGRVMYRIAGKEEKRLTKFTKDIVEPMTALIHDRFPECETGHHLPKKCNQDG